MFLILIAYFERDMKNKSHPKETFKLGSVDQGLPLAAFTRNVYRIAKTIVLTLQTYSFLLYPQNFFDVFFADMEKWRQILSNGRRKSLL